MSKPTIKFVLLDKYDCREVQHKLVYSYRQFIYDFYFEIKIENLDVEVNKIILYKNGEEYSGAKKIAYADDYYRFEEIDPLKKGHYNYKVQVYLAGGTMIQNDFYFKILNGYVQDDIKLISFATYGLHENFNHLKLVAKFDTKQDIDNIAIYRHLCPYSHIYPNVYGKKKTTEELIFQTNVYQTQWDFVGNMELNGKQYTYIDNPFYVDVDEDRNFLYKIIVTTYSGLEKEFIISTLLTPNTFSINAINYANIDSTPFDIYGGVVGRVKTLESTFNDDIFTLILKRTSDESMLTLDIQHDDDVYHLLATNYKITYPTKFNQNQTDASPNIFVIQGECNIKFKDYSTVANTIIHLVCGDNIYIYFEINAEHYGNILNISCDKTTNNIVKYYDSYFDAEQETFENETVSVAKTYGFFTYYKDLSFYTLDFNLNKTIPISESNEDYFYNADTIMYNNNNMYFINYAYDGITIVKFDGINYTNKTYSIELFEDVIKYLKNNICIFFDSNDNLVMKFINTNGSDILQKVFIEDSDMTIIDCSYMLNNIYSQVKQTAIQYLNNIEYIEDYNITYYLDYKKMNYDVIQKEFMSMNMDNFNSKFTMQQFIYSIEMVVGVTQTKKNGISTKFSADLTLTANASVAIFNDNYNIEMQTHTLKIDSTAWQFEDSQDIKNQTSKNIMEKLNGKYLIKLENAIASYNKDDYGYYKTCRLYNGTTKLYNLTVEDLYGEGTTQKYFQHNDVCHAKYLMVDGKGWLMNYRDKKLIISIINLNKFAREEQYIFTTKLFFSNIYNYTDSQLSSFSKLLTSVYDGKGTNRTMYINALSDNDKLYVNNLDDSDTDVELTAIDNISGKMDELNSYTYSYEISYPLNVKNQSDMLRNIEFYSGV